MNSFFDKLMEKPQRYRRNVALSITVVVGLFIFSAWLLITGFELQQATKPENLSKNTAENLKNDIPSLKKEAYKTQLMQQENTASQASQQQLNEQLPGTESFPSSPPIIER
jgi:predicted PurR-regulated permease PerM